MPKFSVVIAVYNKEKYIASTLQSVLNQTFADFEIIVVNDGSTDDSERVIKAFNDARIKYYSQENQGAGAGRNTAINHATANYIALLDADDLWHGDYLKTINDLIQGYSNNQVFATAVKIETPNRTILPEYSIDIKVNDIIETDYFSASFKNTILTSSSTVVHRSVFEKIGNYDTTIKSGQDTDLWIRIGIHYKVVFKNTSLVTYRYVPQSLSNRTKNVINKPTFDNFKNEEAVNASLKKFLDLNRYSMALLAKWGGNNKSYYQCVSSINSSNLNKKQRFLLRQPRFILQVLFGLKNTLQKIGINLSAFR